jgi:hypothetical protein
MSRKKLTVLALATLGVLLLGTVFIWHTQVTVPFTEGMQTNGYDTFVYAASLLVSDGSTVSADQYGSFVITNREAFAAVRQGSKLKVEVPGDAYVQKNLALDKLSSFKGLAQAMKVEGQYAELQQRYGDAANTYLDIIRFGQKLEAGPIIHFLMGLAVEKIGLRGLEHLEPNLQGAERAHVSAELRTLTGSRLAFKEVLDRERYFMRRNSATPVHYFMGLYLTKAAVSKARAKHEKHGEDMARVASSFARKAEQP